MSRVRVTKPGMLLVRGSDIRIVGWSFDHATCSHDELWTAVRDFLVNQIDDCLSDKSLRLRFGAQADVGNPVPVSMEDERAAEMEAYLLINRCQGFG